MRSPYNRTGFARQTGNTNTYVIHFFERKRTMGVNLSGRSFLKLLDLTTEEIEYLLKLS